MNCSGAASLVSYTPLVWVLHRVAATWLITTSGEEEFWRIMKGIEEWRARNADNMLERARTQLRAAKMPEEQLNRTHPRLLYIILDHSSWHDAAEMQEMWAGLLVSSALGDLYDESNLVFVGLLSQMTTDEVLILNHACIHATKVVSAEGVIVAEQLEYEVRDLKRVVREMDLFCLDFQLDHMRTLGLLPFGLNLRDPERPFLADITPSSLALYMFVRCHGFSGSPSEYFACH
jgi:hypothetical protein